jgi:RNA polymerase sigma-70 factor (ECF subfamily)
MRELSLLPQEQREVVVLKIWHSYTFEQIAEVQGASQNTVAGRYRYALQKLRHRLRGLEDEKRIGGAIAFLGAASSLPES